MTDIPEDVVYWAWNVPGEDDTFVDSTGQKWCRGKVERNPAPKNDGSLGDRLIAAAKEAVDDDTSAERVVCFYRIKLKKIYD